MDKDFNWQWVNTLIQNSGPIGPIIAALALGVTIIFGAGVVRGRRDTSGLPELEDHMKADIAEHQRQAGELNDHGERIMRIESALTRVEGQLEENTRSISKCAGLIAEIGTNVKTLTDERIIKMRAEIEAQANAKALADELDRRGIGHLPVIPSGQ